MFSFGVYLYGDLIQEDIQANMSKKLDMTLWGPLSLRLVCRQERHMQMAFCVREFRMWNEKQCLITVFIKCSGRQLTLYYETHRLFFVSNHLTILLQAIAKVLHFCSFSSFPMEITSIVYNLSWNLDPRSGPGWQMKYFSAIPELFGPAAKNFIKNNWLEC